MEKIVVGAEPVVAEVETVEVADDEEDEAADDVEAEEVVDVVVVLEATLE